METAPSSALQRRVTRACDSCKTRRTKCAIIHNDPGQENVNGSCQGCIDNGLTCTFEAPVQKRGPQPGSRKRHNPPSPRTSSGPERSAQRQRLQSGTSASNEDYGLAQADTPTAGPSRASSVPRQKAPFGGVPSRLIDKLLPLYFTHVHNVWPLIYKPTFNPHTTSAPLLLSMLAIASCVTRPGSNTTSPSTRNDEDSVESFPADRLFRMAEKSLRECHNDHRIDLIQSLLLLSLRQTGCGDKQSASMYAGRACSMALNLGLNLMPIPANSNPLGTVGGIGGSSCATSTADGDETDAIDMETRSRVYWNTYVLDKTLSEETGRPFLLTYRKTTTPLPSTEELEEYETWPPPVLSATGHNHRYAHITPRKGYVMSCFAWTCRLGMIVEDILDLDTSYPAPINDWDREFFGRTPILDVDAVSTRLNKWKEALPMNLDVDTKLNKAPLPHHAVGIAWFHTSRILLHSRLINRAKYLNNPSCSPMLATSASNPHMNALSARQICSEAAQSNIDILTCLDKYQLLKVASSDVLHMLSLTALFEAFETTNSEIQSADLAKTNLAQCCKWLRDFSSSWPAASSHRLFFEGLIKGGLKMATTTGKKPAGNFGPECRVPASRSVGHNSTSSTLPQPDSPSTPTTPDGLRSIRRNLSVHEDEQGRNDQLQLLSDTATTVSGFDPSMDVTDGSMGITTSPSALFQLPQIYWNSLNTNTNTASNISNPLWDTMINFEFGSTNDLGGDMASSGNAAPARTTTIGTLADTDWQIPFDHETGPSQELMSSNNSNPDTSVQSALMAFMMQAARGGH